MTITKQSVAGKIAAYLHHEITLSQLVDWAEQAMMEGEFAESDLAALSAAVSRLGGGGDDGGRVGRDGLGHAFRGRVASGCGGCSCLRLHVGRSRTVVEANWL